MVHESVFWKTLQIDIRIVPRGVEITLIDKGPNAPDVDASRPHGDRLVSGGVLECQAATQQCERAGNSLVTAAEVDQHRNMVTLERRGQVLRSVGLDAFYRLRRDVLHSLRTQAVGAGHATAEFLVGVEAAGWSDQRRQCLGVAGKGTGIKVAYIVVVDDLRFAQPGRLVPGVIAKIDGEREGLRCSVAVAR